jgi:adenylate cyclase
MPISDPSNHHDEAFWREFLTRGDSNERRARGVLRLVPHGPRCKLCAAPFAGPGAPVMRALGKQPAENNPSVCNSCFAFIRKHRGGAEIESSFVFADIRGSTTMAERMPSSEFRTLIDRFFTVSTDVVFRHGGGVDKLVGDEITAMFFPLVSGPRHAEHAVEAAAAILQATGHQDPGGPWVPVGAGVSTGMAWIGAVGDDKRADLTALGDIVNVAARLASAARGGEVLVTAEAAEAAGLDADLPTHDLELKGKTSPTRVVSLEVGPVAAAAR